jgi:hypothetical protein
MFEHSQVAFGVNTIDGILLAAVTTTGQLRPHAAFLFGGDVVSGKSNVF